MSRPIDTPTSGVMRVDRLVRQAQRGDAAALDALLTALRPTLLRFARRLLPADAASAEDVVQDAMHDIGRARRAVARKIRDELEQAGSPLADPAWSEELDRLARLGTLHRARGRRANAPAALRAARLAAPTLMTESIR